MWQTENTVHLLLVNRSHIHQIVGTCLWHVRPVCDNAQKPKLLHMPKACPYDSITALIHWILAARVLHPSGDNCYPQIKKRSVINDDPFLRDNEVCYLLCSKLLSSMLSFFDRFRWYDYFGEPAAS